ncbi:hypothetical protein HPB51_000475 [Rhipicephalus microplus]|uniref:Tick transposon n=1 Tax=Rhipicephalus microplus TaxID=6941 RepID=A0A9J6D897_RHIMP|nr:hypothetical protein HPB51_000475 [Rhipicephalus microplus]
MIRDHIVFGTSDEKVGQKLLRDKELVLAKAKQVCKTTEFSRARNQIWVHEQRQIDHIAARQKQRKRNGASTVIECSRCGQEHGSRTAPAFGRNCRRCGGKNVFAVRCKSNRQMAEVSANEDFVILHVSLDAIESHPNWVMEAQVGSKHMKLKVDTGAPANLLP